MPGKIAFKAPEAMLGARLCKDAAVFVNNLSLSSVLHYLGGTGFALWLLVLGLQPDTGFSALLPWLGMFWCPQIG
jgi:hypothetical protein